MLDWTSGGRHTPEVHISIPDHLGSMLWNIKVQRQVKVMTPLAMLTNMTGKTYLHSLTAVNDIFTGRVVQMVTCMASS